MSDLQRSLTGTDLVLSDALPAESPVDALEAPIGAEEVKQLFEIANIAIGTTAAGLVLVDKLLGLLQKYRNQTIEVRDPRSGRARGRISAMNSREEARKLLTDDPSSPS